MFKKKAKKLEVKSETPNEAKVEIKINVRPLVKIERHQLNVNGRDQKPEFRIEIGGRDVITVSGREYQERWVWSRFSESITTSSQTG